MKTLIGTKMSWDARCGARIWIAALLLFILCAHAAHAANPIPLRTAEDVRRAPSGLKRAFIGFLPVKDYQLLSKFKEMHEFDFFTVDATGANDEKLAALSKHNFS